MKLTFVEFQGEIPDIAAATLAAISYDSRNISQPPEGAFKLISKSIQDRLGADSHLRIALAMDTDVPKPNPVGYIEYSVIDGKVFAHARYVRGEGKSFGIVKKRLLEHIRRQGEFHCWTQTITGRRAFRAAELRLERKQKREQRKRFPLGRRPI
ncbi:MAG: hypothetical protein PHD95_01445 [Candidatus ainarchaeum sp.]|nr:hypothetical protein [Candidatus ainarchaeum sp.]